MSEDTPGQPPASEQYASWKRWPKTYREPTHEEWLCELSAAQRTIEALKEELEQRKREDGILLAMGGHQCAELAEKLEQARRELKIQDDAAEILARNLNEARRECETVKEHEAQLVAWIDKAVGPELYAAVIKRAESAEAKLREVEPNAKRYLFIRPKLSIDSHGDLCLERNGFYVGPSDGIAKVTTRMDAAIDAALAEQGKHG